MHVGDKGGIKTMRILLGVFLAAILPMEAHGQTRKEIYELQERCGKSAADMFEKDFPKDERKGLESFENHYNIRLNKCIILEENTLTTRDQGKTYQTKSLMFTTIRLSEVSAR
jgi:hypothetical protein